MLQIRLFVPVFFATHSVPCLADLEEGLVATMHRVGIPPIKEENPWDPCEIDIDASEEISGFDHFGVGSLAMHPLVRLHFPEELRTTLTYSQVLSHLLDYCESDPLARIGVVIDSRKFTPWLCNKHEVSSPLQLGVILKSDLKRELILVREVLSKRSKMEQAFERSYLTRAAQEIQSRTRSVDFPPKVPKVVPQSPSVSEYIEKCKASLESPYPPSFNKLRALLKTKVLPLRDDTNSEQIIDICCEYGMLCLGKRKHRAKYFKEDVDDVDDVDALPVDDIISKPHEEAEEPINSKKMKILTEISDAFINDEISKLSSAPSNPFHSAYDVVDLKMKVSSEFVPKDINSHMLESCSPPALKPTEDRNYEVGRWGEALVYNYLLLTSPEATVEWINEFNETQASYDIVVTKKVDGIQRKSFIEVKSTKFCDRNVFPLSFTELEFMMNHPRPTYDIYRVYNSGNPQNVRICVLHNVFDLIRSKKIGLCLAI